jgi:hypothetical protein
MRGLVALYIRRGYPADEVHKWLYSNLSKRWEQRLSTGPNTAQRTEAADILVLKTQYNIAWNYFNAHQLGDVIMNYWRNWLERADTGNFDEEYPAPDSRDTKVRAGLDWDLRQTNFMNSRVILSRKRTRNFLDASNLWKKSVLHGIEGQALDDIVNTMTDPATHDLQRPFIPDVNTQVVGRRPPVAQDVPNNDDDLSHLPIRLRYPSPTPGTSSWTSAPMNTWGRGARPL